MNGEKKEHEVLNADAADRPVSRRFNRISGRWASKSSFICVRPQFCIWDDRSKPPVDAGPLMNFFALFHSLPMVCIVPWNPLATSFMAAYGSDPSKKKCSRAWSMPFRSSAVKLFFIGLLVVADGVSKKFWSSKTPNWRCKLHGQKKALFAQSSLLNEWSRNYTTTIKITVCDCTKVL